MEVWALVGDILLVTDGFSSQRTNEAGFLFYVNQHFELTVDWFLRGHNTLVIQHWGRYRMAAISDDIFKCISLNQNSCILMTISLKFVPQGLINNTPALVQIMAWHRSSLQWRKPVICAVAHKNIERHTAHTTVSWPYPKQWVIVHTSDLMMIIRQSVSQNAHTSSSLSGEMRCSCVVTLVVLNCFEET